MAAVASAASQIAASRGLPIDTNTNTPSWVEQVPLPLDEDSRKLFIEYAKIPEAELEKHLIEARMRAWECCPYPCIGHWLFLMLQLRKNPEFEEAVRRTRQGHKLLDIGCAVGQDLRDLPEHPQAHAGAPQTMLYGIDLIEHFFEAGKFLFRDPDVQITFRQADVLEPDALQDWRGNFSIVTCNYVFHLMGIEDQEKLAGAILKLLSGKPDDLVFGRTGGTEGEGRHEAFREDLKLYRHSTKSMEELWTCVAAKYGRKAVVESWIDPSPLPQSHWALAINKDFEPVRNLIFSVRLS
ncbi:uncharacterized protein PgNI_02361 [Pyricularia grisea]|uniref:Methyltransferase domain-containing protein n=1 Tax=Pyricularia grisea TaxID=148305 RepID=A0A6P8BF52_PYRGI|nr:uncharacterized protein PgNI_02361 [Pyricularia grisea]TLD15413.1 hypothetical protein PgNI_02361 [Pyricularia grisea]